METGKRGLLPLKTGLPFEAKLAEKLAELFADATGRYVSLNVADQLALLEEGETFAQLEFILNRWRANNLLAVAKDSLFQLKLKCIHPLEFPKRSSCSWMHASAFWRNLKKTGSTANCPLKSGLKTTKPFLKTWPREAFYPFGPAVSNSSYQIRFLVPQEEDKNKLTGLKLYQRQQNC